MLVLAEQNRTFGYAAAASVAVHALVLLMNLPPMRQAASAPPQPPLVAHLAEPAAPPPAPAPPPAVKDLQPAPKPAPAKRTVKPKPKPVPRATVPARPIEEPSLPEQVQQEAPPAPSTEAAPPALAAIAPSGPAPAPDPAEALASFRERVKEVAGRYKRYPPVARDNGWTGDVVVRIEMAASGEVASIRVKTSSGYEVLDQQALEMFRKAVPAVQVPAALRGRDFAVELRAIYNLQDRPG